MHFFLHLFGLPKFTTRLSGRLNRFVRCLECLSYFYIYSIFLSSSISLFPRSALHAAKAKRSRPRNHRAPMHSTPIPLVPAGKKDALEFFAAAVSLTHASITFQRTGKRIVFQNVFNLFNVLSVPVIYTYRFFLSQRRHSA